MKHVLPFRTQLAASHIQVPDVIFVEVVLDRWKVEPDDRHDRPLAFLYLLSLEHKIVDGYSLWGWPARPRRIAPFRCRWTERSGMATVAERRAVPVRAAAA
jgi:hypothetical protein